MLQVMGSHERFANSSSSGRSTAIRGTRQGGSTEKCQFKLSQKRRVQIHLQRKEVPEKVGDMLVSE